MAAAVFLLFVSVAALVSLVQRKHRQTWAEIFRLRREIESVRREVIVARKEAAIAAVRDEPRLPLRMPSQNGEELLLWNFFGRKRSGVYVEIGAYDGVAFSNSYFFEAVGWHGVLVEASPDLAATAAAARPHSRVVQAAAGSRAGTIRFTVAEGDGGVDTLSSATPDLERIAREGGQTSEIEVPVRTLDDILGDLGEPIDFVSLDVEGGELAALEGFDLQRFAPRVLVIEDNSGGTDRRVAEHLAARGYVERARVEQNAFYTRHDDERPFGWSA